MLIAAAPPEAPAPNEPLTLGLGDVDDDAVLLLFRNAGCITQMLGWARVSSQWRRVWRVFLASVDTLTMPAAAPTDAMAAHVRRARSLVYALRDIDGLLATVRELKIGPRCSLDVNELLRGDVQSARTRPGMYDDLPTPALVVLGVLIASNAALVDVDAMDGFERPNFSGSVGGVILVSGILAELQTSITPRALNLNLDGRLWEAPVAIALLGECLKHDASLTTLNLSCNSIAIAGGLVLGEVLEVNASLERLNLLNNTFGPEAAAALVAGAVSKGGQIKTLCGIDDGATSTSFFTLGDPGAILLSYDLTVNASLTELDLDHNNIADAGAIGLGQALEVNASLTTLHLSGNQIGDAGAISLGKALEVNASLTTLYLDSKQIGDAGATSLGKALGVNASLMVLDLKLNKLGEASKSAIWSAWLSKSGREVSVLWLS